MNHYRIDRIANGYTLYNAKSYRTTFYATLEELLSAVRAAEAE